MPAFKLNNNGGNEHFCQRACVLYRSSILRFSKVENRVRKKNGSFLLYSHSGCASNVTYRLGKNK